MVKAEPSKLPFKQVGGWLCLDFVNTVNWDSPDGSHERFLAYADLVRWSLEVKALAADEARQLLQAAASYPSEAEQVFNQAKALRNSLHRIFSAVASDETPESGDLASLNTALATALNHACVTPAEDHFKWGWTNETGALDRVLWPVVRSTAELLTSDKLGRVGKCAGDSCGWLFLDTSRNRSRRWCQMEDCGNRAKARRHYRRKHKRSR